MQIKGKLSGIEKKIIFIHFDRLFKNGFADKQVLTDMWAWQSTLEWREEVWEAEEEEEGRN